MKKLVLLSCVLGLGLPQANGQAETPPLQEGEVATDPLPRVLGEARTREEKEAYQVVGKTEDVAQRAQLAEAFLQNYPDSGLTAYVHHTLADAAYQKNDFDGFILYGEKALLELPNTPELLAQLAALYSQKHQPLKATKYAIRALPLLDDLRKQGSISSIQWVAMRRTLKADAHYALGFSNLQRWHASSLKPPKQLEQAIEHLNQALELAPDYAYAAFRLGFSQKQSDNMEAALSAYARAAVIEGPAAGLAKKNVERIHKNLQRISIAKWGETNVDLLLKDEGDRLRVLLEEKEQELARLAGQIDLQEMMQLDLPPPTLPGN